MAAKTQSCDFLRHNLASSIGVELGRVSLWETGRRRSPLMKRLLGSSELEVSEGQEQGAGGVH